MVHEKVVVTDPVHHCHYPYKRISWTAIFIGALVALGLSFLLIHFGLSIGLSAYTYADNKETIALGGMLGTFIGVIAAMVVAGYAAGYLGRPYSPLKNLGILYGFATWTMALLLGAVLLGTVGDNFLVTHNADKSQVTVTAKQAPDANPNATANTNAPATASSETPAQASVNVQASPNTFVLANFCLFLWFFVSAFAACLGGLWGMSCKRED